MKNEKGITLIALVITIIVLLILAGVSIAMITNENGILGRAQSASVETKLSEDKEAAIMDLNAAYTAFMEEKYVSENTTETFTNFLKTTEGNKLVSDTAHYTYDNTNNVITTKHKGANGNESNATVQENGGIDNWSSTAVTTE